MRKRKLYLTELLNRCWNEDYGVIIMGETITQYYDTIYECNEQVNKTNIKNKEVHHWYTRKDNKILIVIKED